MGIRLEHTPNDHPLSFAARIALGVIILVTAILLLITHQPGPKEMPLEPGHTTEEPQNLRHRNESVKCGQFCPW